MIRESIFYRPRENGFRVFVIREICISLRVICEPTTYAGILFQLFKDFSVLKARKLHHTRCTQRQNQEGLKSSLSACVTLAISILEGSGEK